jgi:Tol biopolymer transport system component
MALESVNRAPAGFCQGAFYGICVMNTRGRHLRKLITNATDLTWSPNGRKITFFRGGIFVATARGSGKRRIAPGAFHRVDWSPDGKQIAYSHETFSEDPPLSAIYVVPVSGGQPTALTTEREPETVASPAFSPDGRSVVFETGEVPGPSGAGLWIVGADGTGARRLTGPGRDPAWQRLDR